MTSSRVVRILVAVVISAVVAAVVAAIILIGPPSDQRKRKFDLRRVQDLSNLEQSLNTYWHRHKNLPPDLLSLSREAGLRPAISDPEHGIPYEYKLAADDAFQLCAEFSFDSAQDRSTLYDLPNSWAHGSGRQCFDLKIEHPDTGK